MRLKRLFCFFIVCMAMAFAALPVSAQDEGLTPAPAEGMAMDMSMYGEVRSVDAAAGTITVQYYDYDSDEEKTSEIAVSKETKLDGASSLGDINQNDWVDVIYAVSGGKNMARSVIVEKEEITEPLPDEAVQAEQDMEGEY